MLQYDLWTWRINGIDERIGVATLRRGHREEFTQRARVITTCPDLRERTTEGKLNGRTDWSRCARERTWGRVYTEGTE